ncbi:GH35 family endo-1,4-beta-xylanase [Bradyrhizobium liaoningense]
MTGLDRREFLLGGAAALAAGSSASAVPASKRAQRRPGYGAAATLWDLEADPRLGEAISTYCTQVVPVLELKWPMLRPDAHTFAFERADAILDFAQANDLTMRGHALAWYHDIPDWTKQIKTTKGRRARVSRSHRHRGLLLQGQADVVGCRERADPGQSPQSEGSA